VSIVVDIQTVSIMLAPASVMAGVIYYAFQIRHQSHMIQQQNRIRETDLVMGLYSTLSSKEFQEAWYKIWNLDFRDYNDFVKRYGSITAETPINIAFSVVFNFFDGIGVLLHKRLADIDQIYNLFSEWVIVTWEKMRPAVEGFKKQHEKEMPRLKKSFHWFEYLYNEMKKREQQLQAGAKNG
jgi:hypothetical protein